MTRRFGLKECDLEKISGILSSCPQVEKALLSGSRAHRDWTPGQIGFIANIMRRYRGEALDFTLGGDKAHAKIQQVFGKATGFKLNTDNCSLITYRDIPGLCRTTSLSEIEGHGWSLYSVRYVGVAPGETVSDEDFKVQLEALNEELEILNAQTRELEETIAENVQEILAT